jgi:hypothetical protein
MKRWVVGGLVRLYPSRWRAEYGEEFSDVLLRRPLGLRTLLDVIAGAARQQEPWVLVGAPLTLCVAIGWVMLLTHPAYALRQHSGSPGIGLAVFFGVGLWTVLRRGVGGGRAAMKVALLVSVPYLVLGLLTLAQVVRVVESPGGELSFRLSGPPSYTTSLFRLFVELPILQVPFAGVLGWLGGLAGRIARAI